MRGTWVIGGGGWGELGREHTQEERREERTGGAGSKGEMQEWGGG